ncbi:protein of unknown function [Methylocaldum szegediense]|uniref:Uncharacterized protein n=1 Tax=Methylocaldum szegediense TaxID=73780 RepID=A0ABN8X8T4_9GAMM|nr:protein of unknown function [Methylocaldum szegediense]
MAYASGLGVDQRFSLLLSNPLVKARRLWSEHKNNRMSAALTGVILRFTLALSVSRKAVAACPEIRWDKE